MNMIEGLLRLADETTASDAKSWVVKRRAVSTAYYAVFHAIASIITKALLPGEKRNSHEYARVYRALEHNSVKSAASALPQSERRLPRIMEIAATLQSERHRSDYLPAEALYTQERCNELLASARQACDLLKQLEPPERRTLAVTLLFKNRLQ